MLLLLFFVGMLGVCFALLMTLLKPPSAAEQVRHRLASIRRMHKASQQQDDPELERSRDDWRTRLEHRLLETRSGRSLADLLLQSRSHRSVPAFLLTSAGIGALLGVVAGVGYGSVLAGICGSVPGSLVYGIALRLGRTRRTGRFAAQLPATASMMARALRAGHSVPQMLELAAEQSKDPLREDFAQLSQEQRLGVPLRDALLSLSRRVPLPDLRFLVSAILIQKETGGDLIQILERTSALIEERLRIRGQIRTFTAQGRMSAWVLTALPLALLALLAVAMPDYASTLFHDRTGQRLLLVGLLLLAAGGYTIRRIVNIEV